VVGPEARDPVEFTIDATQSPKHITIDRGSQPDDGIYEIDGDNLKLSIASRGKRPTDFEGGDGVTVFTLKRRAAAEGE
jgi:uncharacterized protein (TIGR03067 family)